MCKIVSKPLKLHDCGVQRSLFWFLCTYHSNVFEGHVYMELAVLSFSLRSALNNNVSLRSFTQKCISIYFRAINIKYVINVTC